jgi:hypothetical protein
MCNVYKWIDEQIKAMDMERGYDMMEKIVLSARKGV